MLVVPRDFGRQGKHPLNLKGERKYLCIILKDLKLEITRCTQREQNARLHVTSLSSDIKYCKEDNKIKPNM